jgi:1-acyl-sn-glycerol-3-phosphate acyltransferase
VAARSEPSAAGRLSATEPSTAGRQSRLSGAEPRGARVSARAKPRSERRPIDPSPGAPSVASAQAEGARQASRPRLDPSAHQGPSGSPTAARDEPRRDPPAEPLAAAADPLHELEETVDRLIVEAGSIAGDPQARRRAAEALSELAARLGGYENEAREEPDAGLLGGARELLSTDYYVRQWGRLAMRNRSEQVDDFGLDPTYESRVAPLFAALYRRWFRVTVRGIARVPAEGRAMIVANHGGALPWDGLMVRTALRLEHPGRRESRWLAEDFVYHMPFLGAFVTRVGAVRACPENAQRLLEQDELLTVFPEGIKGIGKLFRHRYQLQRFGRGGYVKLAIRTGTRIIPAGIVGSEEAYPLLLKSGRLAKLAGLPFLPITPTFPWLGPLGLFPYPTRWFIDFGEPLDLSGYSPEDAGDHELVARLNQELSAAVQRLIDRRLTRRRSIWLG